MGEATGGTTEEVFAVLNPADLNLVMIDLIWGEEAADKLISQYVALGITDPDDLDESRSFAGLAPVADFPLHATTAAPRRKEDELRAA